MNVYRFGLAMLVMAPWLAQAQTATGAGGEPAGQQQAGQQPASGQQGLQGQTVAPGPGAGWHGGGRGGPGGHDGHGGHGDHGDQGLRPQPAIIVDANALIREGQRANAAEQAQSAPPPRNTTPARKKPGVHLSTSRPLPISTEDAGKP